MRVACALRRLAPDGGTGRYACRLARSLLDRGHEVLVVCREYDANQALSSREGRGLTVVLPRLPRLGSWYAQGAFARAARARIAAWKPDVSLALGRVPGLDVYRAGGGCHAAYLDTVPGWRLSLRHHRELAMDRQVVLAARRVVANAPLPGRQLVERYGLGPERLTVVPNGVDAERFRPDPEARAALRGELGLEAGGRLVLFLGAGFVRKGLETAIEAVRDVDDVVLVAVGGDRGTSRFRRLAGRRGVRLVLAGARPDPERWLSAADAMLLPTRYDAAANAVLEAMAAAVPPITSAANGAAAFLPEPWLVVPDAHDGRAFRDALKRALGEPGLGARCRERALRNDWERSCAVMIGILEEVAGSGWRNAGGTP